MNLILHLLKLTILSLPCTLLRASGTDKTLEDKAVGKDVVEAVTELIVGSNIFSNDYRFLIRAAYVESEFGNDPNTFAQQNGQDYHGGIWQIDEATFTATKDTAAHPALVDIFTKINQRFSIDWDSTTWVECRKPLISALAARLALFIVPTKIPDTIRAQGDFWYSYYNSAAQSGTAQHFVDQAKAMEKLNKCRGRMELVVVMDGSGSVGSTNFNLANQFVASFYETFSPDNVNLGFVVYDNSPRVIFPLDSKLSISEMKDRILHAAYPGGGTDTGSAMSTAVNLYKNAYHRVGSPRIMNVFTDGQSNYPIDKGVQDAIDYNISTFAVGISYGINQQELLQIAANDPTHVLQMDNYQDLSESFEMMNTQTCRIAQTPPVGAIVDDELEQDEKRYYCYELTPDGITVIIEIIRGKVTTYYSYTVDNPSSALNDGVITGRKFIPPIKGRDSHGNLISKVCVTIEGNDVVNNITVGTDVGNKEECRCKDWKGDHCGSRAKAEETLVGNCDTKAVYYCNRADALAHRRYGCSDCIEAEFGQEFCLTRNPVGNVTQPTGKVI